MLHGGIRSSAIISQYGIFDFLYDHKIDPDRLSIQRILPVELQLICIVQKCQLNRWTESGMPLRQFWFLVFLHALQDIADERRQQRNTGYYNINFVLKKDGGEIT